MKKFLLCFLILPAISFAQALSGTYLIGTGQPAPFNTLTAAVNRLNTSGVSGPVTFLLNDTSYTNTTGETFPVRITQFTGSSTVNTFRIKPNTGKNVVVSAANINSYTGTPAVLQVDGADNIIIDGSNTTNGTTRNLSIINADNVSYAAKTAVWISSNGTNAALNIQLLHTKLQMSTRSQPGVQASGIFVGGNGLASNNALGGFAATAQHNGITVRNSEFINVRQGMVINGNATAGQQTSTISFTGNTLGSTSDTQKPSVPLNFVNIKDVSVLDNKFFGIANTDSADPNLGITIENSTNVVMKRNIYQDFKTSGIYSGWAFGLRGKSTNVEITENKISSGRNTVGGTLYGMFLDLTDDSSGILLANNFVSDIASTGTTTQTAHGIYISRGTGTRILHNTVSMNATQPGQAAALYLAAGTEFNVRNNIFSNTGSSGTRYAVYSAVGSTAFTDINYNDYHSTPVGFLGTERTDLSAWRIATGKDAKSLNVAPVFVSVSDLHLQPVTANAGLDNTAQLTPAVAVDIDQQTRSATPDIGADEFAVAPTLATEPSIAATAVNFTNVTSSGFTVNWTNGNGGARMVLIKEAGTVTADPQDGTGYTPNSIMGSGSQIGAGNYVIYAGTGSSVAVTGLSAATTYHIAVYEYNGTGATANYLTTSPGRNNQKTLNPTRGWQIAAANVLQTLTFDTGVAQVSNGPFKGSGFAPTPSEGQLNSNAWSVSGLAGGNILFGGTNTNPDFSRGVSNGSAEEGGIYAFYTAPGNAALGIQPSPSGFVPGSLTLKLQNRTGVPITSLSIGYKVFLYNDQATSSSLNFSHSADNTSFTPIPQLNVVSPGTADIAPVWKAGYRVATLTGINIAPDEFYYLQWSGNAVTPGNAYDEFAFDDIMLSANPSTNYAWFQGTAQDFMIHGNTGLSGDTTVNGDLTFSAGKLSIGSNTITLKGTVNNTVLGGLKGSASSNITISGTGTKTLSFDETTPGTTNQLNNLSVPFSAGATNTVNLANNIAVNGTLNVGLDQVLNLGTSTLSGNLTTATVNGTLRTQHTGPNPFPVGKTFTGNGTVVFDADLPQTVVPGTYNNITFSSTAGTSASGNITVNGILNLPSPNPTASKGSLDMGANTLTMGPLATNAGKGDVTGIITRNSFVPNVVYTFGHPDSSILFTNFGTLPTSMSAKVFIGTAPSWKPGAIQRFYDIIQTGASNTKAVIRQHYQDGELNGNSESKLVYWADNVGTVFEQGRSNFNTTENWVEITNANIGLYFQSTFGKVFITLDDFTEANVLTWNGSVNNSWNTAANWSPVAVPSAGTTVYIPDSATTPNDPELNSSSDILSLVIQPGGILNSPDNGLLTVHGSSGAWINNGTFNPGNGNSKVIFKTLDATIAGSTAFNNLEIASGASLRALNDNYMNIRGTLTNNGAVQFGLAHNTVEYSGPNQVVTLPNGISFAAYHNLIISGTNASVPQSLNIRGDLTVNQSLNLSTHTVNMIGDDAQKIGGAIPLSVFNLVINKLTGKVFLDKDLAVTGTLSLTSGQLVLGSNDLTLGTTPVSGSFSASNMIVADGTGKVRRPYTGPGSYLFPIGELTGNPSYSPVAINISSGIFSGASVSVSVVDAVHPDNHSTQNNLSRYWQITQTGITDAVATVTANYIPQDLSGSENSVAAAQLTGIFNQQTNPWIRFAPVNAQTLTAANASLLPGQVSVFTGIKAGELTADVTGGGIYCGNQEVTLQTSVSGGDMPYSFVWSQGLGTDNTATPPTDAVGTNAYSVTVTDANGLTVTRSVSVEMLPGVLPGSLSISNSVACLSYSPDDITLIGNSAPVKYWQRSEFPDFMNATIISNTSDTLPGHQAGPIHGKTYFRAAVGNDSCGVVFTEPLLIDTKTSVWDGTAWSNGTPDIRTAAVILKDYSLTTGLTACTLTITENAKVTVPSGQDVILNGALTVGSGTLTLDNDTNLVQIHDEPNFGNVSIRRNSAKLFRLDYTMWGSPMTGSQTLLQFSPSTLPDRFYGYNTATDQFIAISSSRSFNPGSGYLIRMRNNHVTYGGNNQPQSWTGTFNGTPTNGPVAVSLTPEGQGFNMVSNPYASMISADLFLEENKNEIEGTLYFWRRRNNTPDPGVTTAYYATYTTAGGTEVPSVDPQTVPSYQPNGYIQVGQGFLVQKKDTASPGNLRFTNAMRTAANNDNQFFRMGRKDDDRSRIWLNITNSDGAFGQTLIAYMADAENGVDRSDGKYIGDGTTALTSWLNSAEYIIQGRAPFTVSDVVPLHFRTLTAGNYTIAVDQVDGLFLGNQSIYLRDRTAGILHNLKNAAYTFTTVAGAFSDRFELVYEKGVLSTTGADFHSGSVVVYPQEGGVMVDAKKSVLKEIEVFDMSGRLLKTVKNINTTKVMVPLETASQVLIFKITSANGQTVSRKVII
ncbi:hypothetical protein EG338_06325 [Kaistella haifensis]|nr:hypothetical protein EG338_06325 [Kaistella haifensis]